MTPKCHCGKRGHPLNSINCPAHGVSASTRLAWALGRETPRGFAVRRIVWGRLLAREERREGEKIVRVRIVRETKAP